MNPVNGTQKTVDSGVASLLPLQVFPFDEFDTPLASASGFAVTVSGLGTGQDRMHSLDKNNGFSKPLDIPKGLRTTLTLNFTLHGVPICDGEIVEVRVAPPDPVSLVDTIVGSASAVLVVAGLVFFAFYRRHKLKTQREVMELAQRNSLMNHQNRELQQHNENLQDSLRKKKHSDKELEVMAKAMQNQKTERLDDLRSVLVPSSTIEIVELLGQGGMGKVHLAKFKGELVAVKQLLTINDDSVKRFRFECFLTKELTHPNCVKMIGVCWDDMMLGCILEYVDGGSLESRLRKDWNEDFKDKLTWSNELLKWATEAALGIQYLHHKRYYDENEDLWKDSIVHRDLKPDNMLVTSDTNTLKLTDFGEARAAELNMTMTAVGTPIFICPEIIRNDRYDTKADSYSYGIVLVAMMRIEDNIVNFFMNALMRKMGKKTRNGVGLGALNRKVEEGWRPTLPKEMYPSVINLIWKCWDDDPEVRPNFDDIMQLLMNEISLEIKTNEEPIFGSGRIIGASDQKDIELGDDGMVSKQMHDNIVREVARELEFEKVDKARVIKKMTEDREKVVAELNDKFNKKNRDEKQKRNKMLEAEKELKKKLEETETELMELKSSRSSGGGEEAGTTQKVAKKKEKVKEKTLGDDEANAEMAALMAMMGR
jgi:serine/threonine protein kinase